MAEDVQVKREITLEADAEMLERMRKEGHARGFTVYCDEAERTGGDNSAPPPLAPAITVTTMASVVTAMRGPRCIPSDTRPGTVSVTA